MSGNLRLLAGALARAKQENRAALITGMTAGFPTVNEGIAAIQAMLNSGADIVEDASCLTCPCRSPRCGATARPGTASPPSSWPRRVVLTSCCGSRDRGGAYRRTQPCNPPARQRARL